MDSVSYLVNSNGEGGSKCFPTAVALVDVPKNILPSFRRSAAYLAIEAYR